MTADTSPSTQPASVPPPVWSELECQKIAKSEAQDVFALGIAREKLKFFGVVLANLVLIFGLGILYSEHKTLVKTVEKQGEVLEANQTLMNQFAWASEIIIADWKSKLGSSGTPPPPAPPPAAGPPP